MITTTPQQQPTRHRAHQLLRRPHHRPSWTCACGNGASCCPSWHCAWPNAWPTSSCRPSSWRTPSCARNVSWEPWFNRLETTGSGQLLRAAQSGETRTQGTQIQSHFFYCGATRILMFQNISHHIRTQDRARCAPSNILSCTLAT